MDFGGRVQFLQAQLFPVCPLTPLTSGGRGFLGSFLSKGLKTNQLEVNTDEKTLRPIARLKEPRDLFALPKDKDNDCSQQAPRWPIECQVIEERIRHIPNVPLQPEPFYQQTGNELKPNPVGEENGIVVFNYNPISAVNYDKSKKSKTRNDRDDSSDSDVSSCESQGSTPDVTALLGHDKKVQQTITNLLNTLEQRSSSNSNEDDEDDEDDDEDETEDDETTTDGNKTLRNSEKKHKSKKSVVEEPQPVVEITEEEIADIWADKSPEYMAATPTYIKTQIDKNIKAQQLKAIPPVRLNDELLAGFQIVLSRSTTSTSNSSNTDSPTEDGEIDADDNLQYQTNHRFVTNYKYPETHDNNNMNNKKLSHKNHTKSHEYPVNSNELAKLSQDLKSIRMQNAKSSKTLVQKQSKSHDAISSDALTPTAESLSPQDLSYNSCVSTPTTNSAPCSSNSSCCNNENHANHTHCAPANKFIKNSYLPQFSRSAVGGSKFLTNCHPYNPEEYDGLEFESRFESGNLAKAIQITPTYYELYLRPDLYTSRSKQWFYFRVKRTKKNMIYRFSIVNLIKSDSLYNEGMRPVMYSNHNAKTKNEGWKRCGENICYYRNDDDSQPSEEDEDNSSYTLTFNIEFDNDNDTVFFAHSYPYTYSDLQDYLMEIQKNPIKSKFCKLRLLCRTLAGNNVYYLTVTTPVANEEVMKRKKSIVISARVHPSETPASWMMKGLMDFITGDSSVAKRLRHKFIFKLIPMLNPDGVIVGNTRNSLTGKDLNRQYRTVIRETYPSIWYTKALIKRLIDDSGVSMYCDMHAHSRRHNIFIYGCENKRNPEKKLTEQVFPLMLHKNVADKFSFENCKFKIQRSKEGTGRIVVWMLGITNSYTIEASFGGSLLGSRKGTHFTTADYEHMGRAFCETLLDYCDENPNKECLRLKIIERLLKEGSSAEEPINIPLSDYSSDEGSSSSSDNEGKGSIKDFSDLEGPCCHPLRAPPCSPELDAEIRKFRYSRMRKVMQELDRIYFQPLFHKKYNFLMKMQRKTFKLKKNRMRKKSKQSRAHKIKTQETKFEYLRNSQNQDKQSDMENSRNITLNYVTNTARQNLKNPKDMSSLLRVSKSQDPFKKRPLIKKRSKGGHGLEHKPRVKISRKLRLWLKKRHIFITRRKMPHRLKFRFKSLHRRKKDERLLLDMPTTDPGSDLLFSTDDEYIDANGVVTCYGTMPRIRRNLLKSELQRHYIEEIGDGLRNMPPELIITSPSNKAKHRNHSAKLHFKPAPERYERKHTTITTNELPYIGEPAKRTSSWHNLNFNGQSPTLTPNKPIVAKNKIQSPFYRPMAKKEPLTKEDLDIKLSLKKKIWAGLQPDDMTLGIDRSRPLSWIASNPLKATASKKSMGITADQHLAVPSSSNAIKRLENEAFLTACSHKLMEWQILNSNPDSPSGQKTKVPLKLVIPEINEERTMRIFKHLANIKPNASKSDNENKLKSKRSTITKIAETSKILTKITKCKARSNLAISHRSMVKQTGNQHKSHGRGGKFKTGGIVVTAVQPIGGNAKKNKKTKSQHNKLPDSNCSNNNTANGNGGTGCSDMRRPSTNSGSGGGIIMAATATTIVRKVKTKLKKKKSPTNNTQNISPNTNYNNSGGVNKS